MLNLNVVSRDTSDAPAQISEGSEVVLAKGGVLNTGTLFPLLFYCAQAKAK